MKSYKERIELMNTYVMLFDDFETLDAFGPAEVFGRIDEIDLHFLSVEGILL